MFSVVVPTYNNIEYLKLCLKSLEKNSNFMCEELFSIGISCEEIVIIKDDKSRIIEKLNNFRKKYSFVFTSGGIGPTHDDITSDSVACALGKKLILNTETYYDPKS